MAFERYVGGGCPKEKTSENELLCEHSHVRGEWKIGGTQPATRIQMASALYLNLVKVMQPKITRPRCPAHVGSAAVVPSPFRAILPTGFPAQRTNFERLGSADWRRRPVQQARLLETAARRRMRRNAHSYLRSLDLSIHDFLLVKAMPLDAGHCDENLTADFIDLMHRADIRMVDLHGGLCLPQKALPGFGILGQLRREKL